MTILTLFKGGDSTLKLQQRGGHLYYRGGGAAPPEKRLERALSGKAVVTYCHRGAYPAFHPERWPKCPN